MFGCVGIVPELALNDGGRLLGWWLVPIAALAGWGVKVVTDRAARWWIGRHRRNKESREL